MIGSWAGELGQTQFLPTHYLNHAVDYDGDGRRNLLRSPADVIGSSAAFIKSLGWEAGKPWLQEVRVPASLAWDQADLAIKHPRSQWAKLGCHGRRRQAAAGRCNAGLAGPADGPERAGLPRLRQLPGLSQVEPVAELRGDRGLSRQPHRRRTADEPRQGADRRAAAQPGHGAADACSTSAASPPASPTASSAPARARRSSRRR